MNHVLDRVLSQVSELVFGLRVEGRCGVGVKSQI